MWWVLLTKLWVVSEDGGLAVDSTKAQGTKSKDHALILTSRNYVTMNSVLTCSRTHVINKCI